MALRGLCTIRPICPVRSGSTISRSRRSRRQSWCPDAYLGPIPRFAEERRGVQADLTYAGSRAMLVYRLPPNEVVFDFYDRLKSVSRDYASFDYQLDG
jgi:translation elongation factor EF-4